MSDAETIPLHVINKKAGFLAQPQSVEWYTPKWVFDKLKAAGVPAFDCDPAYPEMDLPWHRPQTVYRKADDGLKKPWLGTVWLNPPYGRGIEQWTKRASTLCCADLLIALLPSRTDSRWWHDCAATAVAGFILPSRIAFCDARGRPQRGNTVGSTLFVFTSIAAPPPGRRMLGLIHEKFQAVRI